MVDAYQDITIPFQLSSTDFFTEVSEHLKNNGVMVVNLNMASGEDGSINDWLCDTMASVFRHVYTVDVPNNTNREVFCTNSDDVMTAFNMARTQLSDKDYAAAMDRVAAGLTEYLAYYKDLFKNGGLDLSTLLG